MSKFHTPLRVTQTKARPTTWRLDADLLYWSDRLGELLAVPEGFETDFATVPRLPLAYMLTGGKASAAAVVHDWLYSTRKHPRAVADAVFYEAIRASGHGLLTGGLMWLGVRLGGWLAWAGDVPAAD